jgi:very-short-patch-repair endonuclease
MRVRSPESWDLVLRLAAGQRWVVTVAQLQDCGFTAKMIRRLVAYGWLRSVRTGVYMVAGRAPSTWENAVALGLRAGQGSALSHGTAAAIHRLPGLLAPALPEISVPVPRHPRLPDAIVHRVECLDECDVEQRNGVGVTTARRTIVDLAARLDPDLLARVVDEGTIARRWTIAELAACNDRLSAQGRPGVRAMRKVLAVRAEEPRAESMLELRMIRILEPYAPFETQYQLVLEGRVLLLDIAWPRWRVAAEVDGWGAHGRSWSKFVDDRSRMNLLEAYGWRVAHLTAAMDKATVLRDVGRLLPI